MRFVIKFTQCYYTAFIFPISLWDFWDGYAKSRGLIDTFQSLYEIFHREEAIAYQNKLSNLFMRFGKLYPCLLLTYIAFQSLYEIRYSPVTFIYLFFDFPISLWDSVHPKTIIHVIPLSNLFMRFRPRPRPIATPFHPFQSLYEIRPREFVLDTYVFLSNLFMRFSVLSTPLL